MDNIVDISERITERRCRNFMALHAELAEVIQRHRRYGATVTNSIGACGILLADLLAAADPNLEHTHLRELIYGFIDKHADEALLKKWEEMEANENG